MLSGRGARAGRGMPRGWTALCLLSLLPSGFTDTANSTTVTTESPTPGTFSVVPTNVSDQEMAAPSPSDSTTLHPVSQSSNGTVAASSEPTVNFTSPHGITSLPGTMNSSVQTQDASTITVSSISVNLSTSEMTLTLKPSMSPENVSDSSSNNTSPETSSVVHPTSFSSIPGPIQGEIKCSKIKEVKLTHGICLELNETSSCEDFRRDNEEEFTRVLCGKGPAEAGPGVCSLLLVQSELSPHCLLLVLANKTELPIKIQLMKNRQSDLRKMGIMGFTEQDVRSHQSYSRKTLIALVTSGVLLAVLGTTGYFLMNRRSWSPTGERLGEDPYYTENGGSQGYSSGPGGPSDAQGKAGVNRGAQENGTGQATSRNGHSARQHVVADTEL